MTARNEHLALKAAGLVYVTGWIRVEDADEFEEIIFRSLPVAAEALNAPKRKRGRPRKETK